MDFELDDIQKMVRDTARKFAKEEVAPLAAEMDKTAKFRMDLVKKMADLGFLGVASSEEYGGGGMDYRCYAIVIEELSTVCASTGDVVSAHSSLCCDPIYKNGTEDHRRGRRRRGAEQPRRALPRRRVAWPRTSTPPSAGSRNPPSRATPRP